MGGEHWWDESFLSAMGCDLTPPGHGERVCHVLVLPVGGACCGVTLAARSDGLSARVAILQREDTSAVMTALGRRDEWEWATFPVDRLTPVVAHGRVPPDMASTVLRLGDFIDDLETEPLARVQHRRSVFIKLAGGRSYARSLFPDGPDWAAAMPTHAALLNAVWKVVGAAFTHEPLQTFLEHRMPRF